MQRIPRSGYATGQQQSAGVASQGPPDAALDVSVSIHHGPRLFLGYPSAADHLPCRGTNRQTIRPQSIVRRDRVVPFSLSDTRAGQVRSSRAELSREGQPDAVRIAPNRQRDTSTVPWKASQLAMGPNGSINVETSDHPRGFVWLGPNPLAIAGRDAHTGIANETRRAGRHDVTHRVCGDTGFNPPFTARLVASPPHSFAPWEVEGRSSRAPLGLVRRAISGGGGETMDEKGEGWRIFAAVVLGVAGIMRVFDASGHSATTACSHRTSRTPSSGTA